MTHARSLLHSAAVLSLLLGVVAIPANLWTQDAAATVHVRFWKSELRDLVGVRLSFKPAGGRHASPRELGTGGPGYLFDNYTDAPAGHGTLEVYASADKRPLISQPASFAPGAYFTVLLRESAKAGSPPEIEVIEDSSVRADPTSAQITVRNFVANLKDVQVKVGDSVTAQFPSGQGFMQMSGIKPAVYSVNTVGNGPDGKPFEWSTETDLKLHRHQTLLIYPDPYGRIRPRLCVDGEDQVGSPDEKRVPH